MKRVKTRKVRRFKYRIFLYLFCVFLGFELSYNIIMNVKLARSNETFIKAMLVDSNYHLLYDKKASDMATKFFSEIIDVNNPVSILENTLHYKVNDKVNVSYVKNNISDVSISSNPLVYIYNSHQGEAYQGSSLKPYNITPGVMMAAYILQDKLEGYGVRTDVLEEDLVSYMHSNNMKHAKSYVASRTFIEEYIKNNESLRLIIDLHRDSISKESSTVIINDKSCAKIVFVVGNEYDTYEENLAFTNKLNNLIKDKYPNLTRGVLIKGGALSNGVYNQDLNSKIILMEIGSDSNTIDEVFNTIELIVPIMGEFVNESDA